MNITADAMGDRKVPTDKRLLVQNRTLPACCGIVVLAGLLIPFASPVLDVLFVCSICLTAAIVLIGISARRAAEVYSLPGILGLTILIRAMANIAAAKVLFVGGRAGVVVELSGRCVSVVGPNVVIGLCVAGAVVVIVLSARTCRRIGDVSDKYATGVMPAKLGCAAAQMQLGQLDRDEYDRIRFMVRRETSFYGNMARVAGLMNFDAVTAFVTVFVTTVGYKVITITGGDASGANGNMSQMYTVAGLAILAICPVAATAIAGGHLIAREGLSVSEIDVAEKKPNKKITIVSPETGLSEEVELLNPDFVETVRPSPFGAETKESIVSFEPVGSTNSTNKTDTPLRTDTPTRNEIPERNDTPARNETPGPFGSINEYYDDIVARITSADVDRKVTLLAGRSVEDLPVTVAVNVAMRISYEGERILLVDAEQGRNAIAEVFDIDIDRAGGEPVASCIVGLWIMTDDDTDRDEKNLCRRFDRLSSEYDRVLVYAPDINEHNLKQEMFAATGAVMFFGDDKGGEGIRDMERVEKIVMPGPRVLANFANVAQR